MHLRRIIVLILLIYLFVGNYFVISAIIKEINIGNFKYFRSGLMQS